MADSTLRYFTIDEANATLPYVHSIVSDVVRAYAEWRDRVARYELTAADSRAEAGETDEQVALRTEVDQIARRIGGYLAELEKVGCVFKGFDDGLVDFLSVREGRDVFLCWKLGEAHVGHWHEVDAGFAGRRPLAPEYARGESR